MSVVPRVVPIRWRPSGVSDLEAGRALLAQAIAAWQAAWFVTPDLSVEAVALLDPGAALTWPEEASLTWSCGADVWLSTQPQRLAWMVERALDLPASFALTGALSGDRRPALLTGVETKLVDELFDAIHGALSPAPGSTNRPERIEARDAAVPLRLPYGGAHFRLVAPGGDTLLTIVCGAQTLWACTPIKSPAGTKPALALDPRAEAFDGSLVSVSAMLGRCELSVPQLATLAVGDVIGLDRPVTDSVALVLASGHAERTPHTLVATGKPGRHAGKLSIQLTSIAKSHIP